MSKVTGKYQLTLPKRIVEAYGIKVGDELDVLPAGDRLSLVPAGRPATPLSDTAERLRHFDAATGRQRARETASSQGPLTAERGWTREELYGRGRSG